jgi:serine/threonine protein kinase
MCCRQVGKVQYCKIINKEGFGIIFEGTFNGLPVAVKRIQSIFTKNENLKNLNHLNVIQLIHFEEDADFKYFVLELCVASMDQFFLTNSKKYTGLLPSQLDVMLQLINGVNYIHSQSLVHLNIKPSNILISSNIIIKISGFENSKKVHSNGTFIYNHIRGSKCWMPPEITLKNVSLMSDIWMTGCVFFYHLTQGYHPFGSEHSMEIVDEIYKGNPVNLKLLPKDHYAYYAVKKMLNRNPDKRMLLDEIAKELDQSFKAYNKKLEKEIIALCKFLELHHKNRLFKLLNCKELNINCRNSKGKTPLLLLCSINNFSLLKWFIQQREEININCKDNENCNALHYVCKYYKGKNLMDAIKMLIEKQIDINVKNWNGQNALFYLCLFQKQQLLESIQLLVYNNININSKDWLGRNVLTCLCENYKQADLFDIIKLLVNKQINVNSKSKFGKNALHILCASYSHSNLIDIVKILINSGIEVNAKDQDGNSALHLLYLSYTQLNLIDIAMLL